MATSIEILEEAGVRSLHFGSHWIQGAMRIARPHALELEYTREMMLALLLRRGRRWPRHVLQIGLGAASLTKFLYRNRPHAALTVVEIEPAVVAAARQFFKLPEDPKRVIIEIADGHEYVAKSAREFDLILVDGFDAKGRAGMLDMLPFHCNARARLSRDGLFVANLLTRTRGVMASLERIRTAFDGRALCAAVGRRRQHDRPRSDRRPDRHSVRRPRRGGPRVEARHRPQSVADTGGAGGDPGRSTG